MLRILRTPLVRRNSLIALALAALSFFSQRLAGSPGEDASQCLGQASSHRPPSKPRSSATEKPHPSSSHSAAPAGGQPLRTKVERAASRAHNCRASLECSSCRIAKGLQQTSGENARLPEPGADAAAPARSYSSLVRQNDKTEADGLERIEDDDDLADRIARKMLVPVPVSATLNVNARPAREPPLLPPLDGALSHRSGARPCGRLSLAARGQLGGAHRRVPEAADKINGNAAAAEGDIVSPHLTGATIDIAKQGLSRKEMAWMRAWLLPLQKAGKIDVEEEFQQTCFHITVYKSYMPPAPARKGRTGQAPSAQAASRTAQAARRASPHTDCLRRRALRAAGFYSERRPA